MVNEFQHNPFWDYSLSLYEKPGVADACLYLQDKFGLDVNLLLFCVWFGASGRGPLDADEIDNCVQRTGDWRTKVIEPLRAIRLACREEPLGVPEFLLQVFRPRMREIELHAEHVEQLVLAETVRNRPAEDVTDDVGAHDAQLNLLAYLAAAATRRDSRADECIHALLAAAFPGAEPGERA